MALINIESKLCDIVISDPTVLTVLNRFDIVLGVGYATIGDACIAKKLDPNFFITILNTFINENYFPENIFKSFSANKIIDYLNKTNSYYQQFQIPNIERHFNSLVSRSDPDNSNLGLMLNFFYEVKTELLNRISFDNNQWFSHIACMEQGIYETDEKLSACQAIGNADTIEEKLSDLISMFVIHLKGEYDINLCHAVLVAIITLQKDIIQNNRIRNKILKPIVEALENKSIK
jgi:hypothetical protein